MCHERVKALPKRGSVVAAFTGRFVAHIFIFRECVRLKEKQQLRKTWWQLNTT